MIQSGPSIVIDDRLVEESFVRASGPGGQNVNKVSSAVQLRFNAADAPFPESMQQRLRTLAGRRMTQDGVIVIVAQSYRDQERNRADARARLQTLLNEAALREKPRRATRPTLASQKRRLDSKTRRSRDKDFRSSRPGDD